MPLLIFLALFGAYMSYGLWSLTKMTGRASLIVLNSLEAELKELKEKQDPLNMEVLTPLHTKVKKLNLPDVPSLEEWYSELSAGALHPSIGIVEAYVEKILGKVKGPSEISFELMGKVQAAHEETISHLCQLLEPFEWPKIGPQALKEKIERFSFFGATLKVHPDLKFHPLKKFLKTRQQIARIMGSEASQYSNAIKVVMNLTKKVHLKPEDNNREESKEGQESGIREGLLQNNEQASRERFAINGPPISVSPLDPSLNLFERRDEINAPPVVNEEVAELDKDLPT